MKLHNPLHHTDICTPQHAGLFEQVEQAAAEVLKCSEAWRKGGATAKPVSTILRLLAALDELPAAAMLNAAYAVEGQFLGFRVTLICSAAIVSADAAAAFSVQ